MRILIKCFLIQIRLTRCSQVLFVIQEGSLRDSWKGGAAPSAGKTGYGTNQGITAYLWALKDDILA